MIRPWEDAASDLLAIRDEVDRESWKWAALTEAIDCVRQAAVLENNLNARISELEEHAGTLHNIVKANAGWAGTIRCRVCGWRK
jgi:hypothetical protein